MLEGVSVRQWLANFFYKHLKLWGPRGLCLAYATPSFLLQSYVNEWVWLGFNKTLFTETGSGAIVCQPLI